MENIYMFQKIFLKVDEFGWLDMDRIQTDSGTQFTSKDFHEGISVRVVQLSLGAPDHQEINGKFEVTW